MEYPTEDFEKDGKFEKAITIIILICSCFSFGVSIYVLITKMIYKKIDVTFSKELMIYLTISEIVNSLSKITLFYKFIQINSFNQVICNIQVISSLITDYLTLMSSTILSIQICYTFQDEKQWFKQQNNKTITRVLVFAVPSFFTILFTSLHFSHLYDPTLNINKNTYLWCWVNPKYSLGVYGSYIIMLTLIFVYSKKTMNFLRNKQQKLIMFINEEEEEEYKSDAQVVIENVSYSLRKITYYPIISFSIWFLLFVHRIIDFFENNENDFWWERIFIVFHAIICSSRGIVYGAFYLGYGLICCKSIVDLEKKTKKNENALSQCALTQADI